ncbi:MAG: hypothetical protein H6740_28080 [Alphaproteobacteria bacterium]|nr:hypothetical protein [Alphaproteobacteria bacterium]
MNSTSALARWAALCVCLLSTGCSKLLLSQAPDVVLRSLPASVVEDLGCTAAPAEERFEVVFGSGQICGMILGEEAWALEPSSLSPEWQRTWYDGVGHGMKAPPADLSAWRARVDALPAQVQPLAHEAAVRAWTVSMRGEPARVLPWVEGYGHALERDEAYNGVRTGLQWSRGADLDAAIQLALGYPEAWHPALLEELGWRAGDRRAGLVEATLAHADALPEASRCAFFQGAARGFTLRLILEREDARAPGWAEVSDLAQATDPACHAALWGGVGWAAVFAVGRDPERVARALAPLGSGPGPRSALRVAAWASDGAHAPWSLPSEQPGRPLSGPRRP